MDFEDKVEDLRRRAINMLSHRDGMPEEVKSIIERIKQQLLQITEERRMNFPSIIEYIQTEFETFKRARLNQIGQKRREDQIEETLQDINEVKNRLENELNSSNILEKRKEEDGKEARNTTTKLLNDVDGLLSNIYSHQRRILYARGYSPEKIDETSYELKNIMRNFIQYKCGTQIEEAFNKDNLEVRKVEEEVILEIVREAESKTSDNRESFQQELRNGAPSMEEQALSAEERRISENKKAFKESEKSDDVSAEQKRSLLEDLFK